MLGKILQALLSSALDLFIQKNNLSSVGPLESQYLEMSPLVNESSSNVLLFVFSGMKEC